MSKPSLKIKTEKVVQVSDWDKLVQEVYGRPYKFQQQDGCKERGVYTLEVPDEHAEEFEYENETVLEEVNGPEMGVSFKAWLARDPKQKLPDPSEQADYCLDLWWYRNFYPAIEMIANDLHSKGLLEKGRYLINIDW